MVARESARVFICVPASESSRRQIGQRGIPSDTPELDSL